MKQLKELVQIVTRHRQPKPDFIDENFINSSEDEFISKLYHGIRQGKYAYDQSAAEEIYGKPIIDAKYTTLKSRLKSKLLNSLFFLNITRQDYSEKTVADYKISKMIFWMRSLSLLGAMRTSIKISESLLPLCEKYQSTPEAIANLLQLRRHYGASGNAKEYDIIDEKLKIAVKQLNDELVAREYYERVSLRLAKSSVPSPDFAESIEKLYSDLISRIDEGNTFEFRINTFRLGIYAYQQKQTYNEVITISNEAIEYLEANPTFTFRIRMGEFMLQKLEACLYVRNYSLGNETALKSEDLLRKGTNLWFGYMELYFLLAMQTDHYEKAREIFDSATQHERFQFQLDQVKERWKIGELYLEFAQRVTATDESLRKTSAFDLKRFLRNVPVYSQDKRGLNVAILIIHVLLLLEQNDFDAIISRMDALRTYRTRYLRARSNSQSTLFFKMLQIMESTSFSYKETEKRTRKLYEQLITIATDTSEIQEGIMILRFETLWKLILGLLEQKEKSGVIRI